jgi:hypothetical protein
MDTKNGQEKKGKAKKDLATDISRRPRRDGHGVEQRSRNRQRPCEMEKARRPMLQQECKELDETAFGEPGIDRRTGIGEPDRGGGTEIG